MTDTIEQLKPLVALATFIKANFGTILAVASAVFAFSQARSAKRSLRQAKRSLRQAQLLKLFGSFDVASESTIAHPEFLYSVHGLARDVPLEEARNIAYLSLLLDAFQHFYYEHCDGDFTKMITEMKSQSTFLNRILTVAENKDRWDILKKIYYGGIDSGFVAAIDTLMPDKRHMK